MNKLLLALLALCAPIFAQAQPDCPLQQATFNAAGNLQFDNRNCGGDSWTVWYIADSTLTFTLAFQSQNVQSANPLPGSWVTYTGNTSNSSSSFGTAAAGIATYCGLATCVPSGGVTVETSWVRVNLSGVSGPGQIRVFFYGYRTGYAAGLAGGGGGGSGCPNPCPVEGTAAAGGAPVGPPVLGAGSDGTDVRTLKTDTSGDLATFQIGLGTFTSGQQAVTGTAANLGTATAKGVCLHALVSNTISVYAGASGVTTSTGMEIPPGYVYCWSVSNTNLIYVIASTTGASVSWSLTN